MNQFLEETFVLPPDVLVLTDADIHPGQLDRLAWTEGDCVITRKASRGTSHKVDADTAALLEHFRAPRTILQAVFRHSLLQNLDARDVLQSAFPALGRLVQVQLLVPAASVEASPLNPAYPAGSSVAGLTVLRCVQCLDDAEVYEVQDAGGIRFALKIAGQRTRAANASMLEREEIILRHLNGVHNPRLATCGVVDGKQYLVTEWCAGANAAVAAEAHRKRGGWESQDLTAVCCNIVLAYADLHLQGVTHADVHPRNVILTEAHSVKVIDFGRANLDHESLQLASASRAGVGFYFEPEYVRAKRLGHAEPAATQLGEQYQVGALLYFLLTGAHYLDFHLDRSLAYEQIEVEVPRPFTQCGRTAWPEVETVLQRALSKDPQTRFPSVGEFANELVAATRSNARQRAPSSNTRLQSSPTEFSGSLIEKFGEPGSHLLSRSPQPPSCSVNYGAAGIAYMFYRLACVRGSAELLSRADLWSSWAVRNSTGQGAFASQEFHLTRDVIGPVSLYHTRAGVHCVGGLVSLATGNLGAASREVDRFIAGSEESCDNLDLTLGRSSTLIGCTLLYDSAVQEDQFVRPKLLRFGNSTLEQICSKIESYSTIRHCTEIRRLGMAHGWAGFFYAVMQWCRGSGTAVPEWLGPRLEELAEFAEANGDGLTWALRTTDYGRGQSWPGWCRGSAGFVFLWMTAYRIFRSDRFLGLAEKAAWHVWAASDRSSGNLCCGLTGQAYALLHVYRNTKQQVWIARARELGQRAIAKARSDAMIPGSLYKGDVGVALLATDLEQPERAVMPMFEL